MKNNYKIRKPKKTNMISEKFLSFLERDIAITFIVLLIGLINKGHGGISRGWPVPWLISGRPRGWQFFVSLLIAFGLVAFIDFLVMIVRVAKEPLASAKFKQFTANPYPTDDSVEVDVKTSDSTSESVRVNESAKPDVLSQIKRSKTFSSKRSRGSSGSPSENVKKKNAAVPIIIIAVIFIISSVLSAVFDNDHLFEVDDGNEYEASEYNDEDWDYKYAVYDISRNHIDSFISGDMDEFSFAEDDEISALQGVTDWSETQVSYDVHTFLYEAESGDPDARDAVIIWLVEDADDNSNDQYLVAFKYMDVFAEDGTLMGVSACKVNPDWHIYSEPYSDEEEEQTLQEIEETCKSAGDHYADDKEILIWWGRN